MKHYTFLLLCTLIMAGSCTPKCDPINAELTGQWQRVDGDNSPLNGMVVDFAGNTGALTTVPTTAAGFRINDAKWRSVTKERDGVFTLEDRDSAGGYVKSRILILADGKEMMLSATTGALGNYQKWKRL